MRELVTLGTAFMFLTRLPVGRFCSGDSAVLARSTRYFPLIGCIVGVVLSLSLWLLQLVFPALIAVVLMLVLSLLLTGALHEDGLADVADSAGAHERERKLEIMRDSQVGSYGVLALILVMFIKVSAIWELVKLDMALCFATLVCAHACSRWSSVWLMAHVNYARASTANKALSDGVKAEQSGQATACLLLAFVPVALLVTPGLYALLPLTWFVSWLCARRFEAAFGGITGDCLGATNQIVECMVYLAVLAVVVWH